MDKSIFETLNSINVNEHTEKKNGLTYLSWAWAWGELLKRYPDSVYTVYENKDGWIYHTDGRTAWVKTGVTVQGKEYIEFLPVMDYKNRSIPLDNITSFDVNKAIQRSLTKAVARHGLGLYIYAGEDLPEGEEDPAPADEVTKETQIELPKVDDWSAKAALSHWCKVNNITLERFGQIRAAVIEEGKVPDIKSSDLTKEQFGELVFAVTRWVADHEL